MSSKIQTSRKTKKKAPRIKQTPKKGAFYMRPRVNKEENDDTVSDDSCSLGDTFPIDFHGSETDDTDNTASTNISQEFSDEDELMKYYETKVRGNGLFERASDESAEESELPQQLKKMMDGFRKLNFRNQPNRNDAPDNLPAKVTSDKPSAHSRSFMNKAETRKRGGTKKVSKHASKRNDGEVAGPNKLLLGGVKRRSKADQRVPLKEEASFQKSSFSQFSRGSGEGLKRKAEEPVKRGRDVAEPVVESHTRRASKNYLTGFLDASSKTEPEKVVRDKTKDRRNKIISYLGQIDEAESTLQPHSKMKGDDESSDPDTTTTRTALLRKYGFELTSNDELLKLGGTADKRRRREKRKLLFPTSSSSSSSSGSDVSLNGKEVEDLLKSFLGKKGEDVDVYEMVRHGRKWRNCLEDGDCQCRPRNKEEDERIELDRDTKMKQFLDIFDGKDPPDGEYSREDLLKAHDKIAPWVHQKTKKLDKFIKSGKNSPQYLLNIWDGRLSGDSSGDEPDFDKYREEYKKKLAAAAQEDGTPISPEDRVPTLQENNWFLFPTPITRKYGKEETASAKKFNSRAAMEVIASDLKRSREVERAKEFLETRPFPEPHMYPRPIDLSKNDTNEQIRHPLLGLLSPSTTGQ